MSLNHLVVQQNFGFFYILMLSARRRCERWRDVSGGFRQGPDEEESLALLRSKDGRSLVVVYQLINRVEPK